MSDSINDTKNKINELAEILVTLDDSKQHSQIETIKKQVWSLFFSAGYSYIYTDSYGNDWYEFPLLDNIKVPFETAQKTIDENLRKSKKKDVWIFNPHNGDFITTLIRKIKYKVQRNDSSMLKGYLPVDNGSDSDDMPKMTVMEYEDPVNHIAALEEKLSNQQKVKYIADLIIKQTRIENGNENKQHFEGFFTHDRVTEERSTDGAYITDEYSSLIFPAMSIKMLEYLMEGSFSHMRDLVTNKVRDFIKLTQCVKNVGDCFEMKSPKHYHVKYKEWLVSINPYK